MMDAATILQTITLAVVGWTLLEVIGLGKEQAKMKQKLQDLPCGDCEIKKIGKRP
jgi:hypothetical protein